MLLKEADAIQQDNPDLVDLAENLNSLPSDKLEKHLSLDSTLDDLQIIRDSASLIMKIKEELIGPAREQAPRPTMVDDVLKDAIHSLDLPPE